MQSPSVPSSKTFPSFHNKAPLLYPSFPDLATANVLSVLMDFKYIKKNYLMFAFRSMSGGMVLDLLPLEEWAPL